MNTNVNMNTIYQRSFVQRREIQQRLNARIMAAMATLNEAIELSKELQELFAQPSRQDIEINRRGTLRSAIQLMDYARDDQ